MPAAPDPTRDPLRWVLRETFNINVQFGNWSSRVHRCVLRLPDGGAAFRRAFATAIVRASFTPAEYHALTEESRFDTNAELAEHLRELWTDLYGEELTPEDFAYPPDATAPGTPATPP